MDWFEVDFYSFKNLILGNQSGRLEIFIYKHCPIARILTKSKFNLFGKIGIEIKTLLMNGNDVKKT